MNYGGSWENQNLNFDNVFESLLTLFVMVTGEGWITVMLNAVDSTGQGMEPKENTNQYFKLLFIIYMLFSSMFITNILIEAVIAIYEK